MKLKKIYLAGLTIVAAIAPLGLAPTRADYYWPNDTTRNSYYRYNPGGGTPYFFTPDSSGAYNTYDGQNRLAVNASQVTINTGDGAVLQIYLDGANAATNPTALNQIYNPYPYNSSDYWKWRASGNQTYANVRYNSIYPGTDLTYYNDASNGYRRLGYDFTVNPGYSPNNIVLDVRNASRVTLDNAGNLIIVLSNGQTVRKNLRVWQSYNGQLQSVPGSYNLLDGNRVGFNVANYDTARPLFIDPVLSYSPYDNTYGSYDTPYYNNGYQSSAYSAYNDTSGTNGYYDGYYYNN